MSDIVLKPRAKKFIETLPPKHKNQVKSSVLALQDNPIPHDVKKLMGYENYLRRDVGEEYRVIYKYEEKENLITVVLAGKRNDDNIYRIAKRTL